MAETWKPTRWQTRWQAYDLTVMAYPDGRFEWMVEWGLQLIRIDGACSLQDAQGAAMATARRDHDAWMEARRCERK